MAKWTAGRVLDGTYRVEKIRRYRLVGRARWVWVVVDLATGRMVKTLPGTTRYIGDASDPGTFPTMKAAKAAAEDLLLQGDSDAR